MAEVATGILTSFKESLAADKKKTAVLCGLCLVLVVLLVRQLFFGPSIEPAAAAATSPVVAGPANAAQPGALIRPTVEATGAAPQSGTAVADLPRSGTVQLLSTASASEKVVSVDGLPRTLSRNIFDTTSWHRFARLRPSGGDGRWGAEQPPPGLLTQLGRKLAAYGRSQREEERRVDEELATLRLESTMTGQVPLAHISGRLVREGDQIEGFSVVQIRDRQVMLRKSGVTRVLTMP